MKLKGIFAKRPGAALQLRQVSSDSRKRIGIVFQLLLGLTIALIAMVLGYFYPLKF